MPKLVPALKGNLAMKRIGALVFLMAFVCITFISIGCTKTEPYVFAVVGDLQQPNDRGYKPVTHKITKQIAASEAEFLVIVGDLVAATGNQKWEQFDELVEPIREAGKEIYAAIGNNDSGSKAMSEGFLERFDKHYQVISKPGLWLVLLDSENQTHGYRDWQLGYEQTEWLRNKPWKDNLAGSPNGLLFFFLHRPTYRSKLMKGDVTGKYGRDKPEIAHLLDDLGADVVFSGHEHLFEKNEIGDVTYFITGGGGGVLLKGHHHFLLVTIFPNKKKWKVKVVKLKTDEEPQYHKFPWSK